MARQREWRCACGAALLLQTTPSGVRVFDGADEVHACPRCQRDLSHVDAHAAALGEAIVLLDRARAGEQLERPEHEQLAAALGLEPVTLDALLEQVRRRSLAAADR